MKINFKKLNREHITLGILILLLVLLRVPSIFEPHWNRDEGLYASIGSLMHNGALLYRDIWDHHPPLIYFLYYCVGSLGNFNLIVIKITNLLLSIISLIFVYKVGKELTDKKVALISSLLASLLLGLPLFGANAANPENIFLPCTLIGIYLSLKGRKFTYFLSGIFWGLALLTSIKPVFECITIFIFIILSRKKMSFNKLLYHIGVFVTGFIIPVGLAGIYFVTNNISKDYFQAVFKYHSENSSSNNALGFILFPNVLLTRSILFLTLYIIFLFIYWKKKISLKTLFISLWGLSSLYGLLSSQTPYPYHLLEIIPFFSLITVLIIIEVVKKIHNLEVFKLVGLYLLSIFFILTLFSGGLSFPKGLGTIGYYRNFIEYLTGKIDTTTYIDFFGSETTQTYKLNSYLSQMYQGKSNIYIWTDNSWIYPIAHITPEVKYLESSEAIDHWGEIKSDLIKSKPTVVIIDKNAAPAFELKNFLQENGYTTDRFIGEYELFLPQINVSQ